MRILLFSLFALFLSFSPVAQAQINLTQGLIMYFPFTGNATDASGNGNIATVNGPVLTTDRFGTANSAYHFDGIDDFISLVNGPGMKPQYPFSFACWGRIYNVTTGTNTMFMNDYVDDSDYGTWYNFSSTANGFLGANVGDGGTPAPQNRLSKVTTTNIVMGTWYHFAAVVNSETDMKLYINCDEVPGNYSGTGAGLIYSANGQGVIGKGDGGPPNIPPSFIEADLDEVRFYNRALNPDEVKALYYWPVYPPALTYQLPTDTLNIQCGSTVNIDGTAQGIISYTWDDNTTSPTKTFSTPGTYIVTVSDGCFTGDDTLTVTASQGAPVLTLTAPGTVCVGSSTTITASGATGYTWSPATGLNTTTGPVVVATLTDTTTYTVTGTSACGNATASITINAVNQIQPLFTYSVDECSGLTTTANLGPQTGNYLWVWDGGDTTSTFSPQISFMNAGQHDVFLISNPGTACADTLRQNIATTASEKELVYIPNSFTPNGDGINEYFGVYTAQTCLEGELYIFDNWGEEVFYTDKAFTTFWNGNYKGKRPTNWVFAYRLVLNTGKEYYGKVVVVR